MRIHKARVLAVDPISKGFAFVALEGPERLIDWGTAHVPNQSKHAYLERFRELMEENLPDLIVMENYKSRCGRKNTRAKAVLQKIQMAMETEVACDSW